METIEQRKARRKAAAAEKRAAIKAMRETWEKASKSERVTAENALYLAAREYTEKNRELLAMQCHARGLHVSKVQSASKWREAGRKVRKGEKALMLYAPIGEEVTESGLVDIKKPKWFKLVPVFDISQTEPAEAASTREKSAPAKTTAPKKETAVDRVRRELEDWHKFMARHGRTLKFRLEEDDGACSYSILLDDMSIADCAAEEDLESAVENALQILGCVKLEPEPAPSAPEPEPETAGDLFAWQPAFAAIG